MGDKKIELEDFNEVFEEAKDLAVELSDAGADKDKTIDAIADFLDAIIPLNAIIPGPLGELAEEADGIFFDKLVRGIAEAFKVDPIKRAERREGREKRKELRQDRRADRREERRLRKTNK